jgi:hypothetical protein
VVLTIAKVPRHIQKQREEAAQAGQGQIPSGNGLSLQTGATFDGSDVIPEIDEEIWSPNESTPIAQHFPGKVDMHNTTSPGWQNLNTSKSKFFNWTIQIEFGLQHLI